MRRATRPHLAIASLLTFLLMLTAALPATGATVRRSDTAEKYAHRLVNCLRTGGKITIDGRCKGYGSGKHSQYVKPLKRSAKISNKVAWPWARRSVQWYGTRACWIGHSRYGSTVDSRFRKAGLRNATNGENMGCYRAPVRAAVRKLLRMWQREKAWYGWHWRNIKSKKFQSVGYGVARYGKRKTQLVIDFYGPLVD
jgi:hypothetical protein